MDVKRFLALPQSQQQLTLTKLAKEYQEFASTWETKQIELRDLISKRQNVDSQLSENKTVQDELNTLPEDAAVFKLTGPVLCQVDLEEAKDNVNSRLNKFETSINRAEKDIKRVNDAINKKRDKMVQYQQFFQQVQLEGMRKQQEQQQKLVQRAQQRQQKKTAAKPPKVNQQPQ